MTFHTSVTNNAFAQISIKTTIYLHTTFIDSAFKRFDYSLLSICIEIEKSVVFHAMNKYYNTILYTSSVEMGGVRFLYVYTILPSLHSVSRDLLWLKMYRWCSSSYLLWHGIGGVCGAGRRDKCTSGGSVRVGGFVGPCCGELRGVSRIVDVLPGGCWGNWRRQTGCQHIGSCSSNIGRRWINVLWNPEK